MTPKGVEHIFLNILKKQLQAADPPFVAPTLQRLRALGYADETARRLIAGIIAQVMAESIEADAAFDNIRYRALLDALPELPVV